MDFNQFQQTKPEFEKDKFDSGNFNNFQSQLPNKTVKKSFLFWVGWLVLVVILGVAISFGVALMQEINNRNKEIDNIKNYLKTGDNTPLIDESLINQIKGQLENDSLATETSTGTSTVDSDVNAEQIFNSTLSRERRLAEKRDRPTFGNPNADLVIVGFIDFECPFCQDAFPALRTMMNKYEKDILFIFRNYPVLGDQSSMLAQAGMCVNEQGKFWSFHDRYFPAQGQIQTSESLQSLLLASGVDLNSFSTCISEQKYRNMVQEDIYDALDLGVSGTPTFFINGYKLAGVVTLDAWEQIIKNIKN
jgi:protein-disulfide isomerase